MASQGTHPSAPLGGEWPLQALDVAVAVNREWLSFISRRLGEDIELAMRLPVCRSPDEMWRTCASFWSKAAVDYQDEFATLMQLGSGAPPAAADTAPDVQRPLAGGAD
jgi:hypothetical protein